MEEFPDFFTENIRKELNMEDIEKMIPLLENHINMPLLHQLSGPLQVDSSQENIIAQCIAYNRSVAKGISHLTINEYQLKYGDKGFSSNIQVPILEMKDGTTTPILRDVYIISHPDDGESLAMNNIKKMPNFKPIVADSIISTTDNNHWRTQRYALNKAFLPSHILQHLFKDTNELASKSVQKLRNRLNLKNHSLLAAPIDMNDFLLALTQEQVQRILLGMPKDFTDETNTKIRNAFNGKGPRGYTRFFTFNVWDEIQRNKANYSLDAKKGILGPISAIIGKDNTLSTSTYGNIILAAFAGHDTTGHTLTWLLHELSKYSSFQHKLRKEVDLFWKNHPGNIVYNDLKELPFMTKCIHETLRLWPAVANGTFRELEHDTYIHGHGDNKVLLPKGSYTQILNWSRHRNKALWGEDADQFNPEREWIGNEIWGGAGFAAYNPSSYRFSPFTYAPRDCLGKNFAQMEMRLILLYLLRDFYFFEDPSDTPQHGYNRATLAPINMYADHNYPDTLLPVLETGCYMTVVERKQHSRL
jgi:cytochrome P450